MEGTVYFSIIDYLVLYLGNDPLFLPAKTLTHSVWQRLLFQIDLVQTGELDSEENWLRTGVYFFVRRRGKRFFLLEQW